MMRTVYPFSISNITSLNVHEALTFDGTEIVLHPDLFGPDGGNNSLAGTAASTARGGNLRPSSSAGTATLSTAVPPTTIEGGATTQAAQSSTQGTQPANISNTQQGQQQGAALTPAPSNEGSKVSWAASGATGVGGGGGASAASHRRLEVGDMIEVRVWDPIPASEQKHSPSAVSSVFRRKSNRSVQSAQSSTGSGDAPNSQKGGTSTIQSTPSAMNNTATTATAPNTAATNASSATATKARNAILESVVSNLSSLSRKAQASPAGSMQYSDFSASEHTFSTMDIAPISSKSLLTLSPSKEIDGASTTDDNSKGKDVDAPNIQSIVNNNSGSVPSSPMQSGKVGITLPSFGGANTGAGNMNTTTSNSSNNNTNANAATNAATIRRANTADVPRMPLSSATVAPSGALLPKPPLQPRASTHGETYAAYEARKRSSKPIHSREISDMTADSIMGGSGGGPGLVLHPKTSGGVGTSGGGGDPNDDSLDFSGGPLGLEFVDQGGGEDDNDDDNDDDYTQEDDILSVIGKTHTMRFSFAMLVGEKTLTSLKGSARTQVSILRQVADLYGLSSYDMVTINRIEKEDEAAVLSAVSADFVLVSIKDQFVSRGDMHLFQKSLLGSWIYEGQRLTQTARGIKAHAWLIRHGDRQAKSGIVTEDTMITFRSRSSRIFWLVQISAEMWDYASPYVRERGAGNESVCEIYFDKWISFVYRLFDKWKEVEVTHSLTVVFFSRTFLSSRQAMTVTADGPSLDCKDVYGRPFEDHYKTVIENETKADWESLVIRLKEEFLKYPLEVGWNLSAGDLGRRPSNAAQGNVLEAINITSNLLQFHYLDRDLHRTGNSLVVISPGCGVFEVDKGLASITYQRMMDNGIGSDMLSLGLPPLHVAPFFLYNNEYRAVESRGVDTSETYYEIPHWMHLAFVSYEGEGENPVQPKSQSLEAQSQKDLNAASAALPVVANGFIMPQKASSDSFPPSRVKVDPNSPTSFSVNGIAASSPEKITKQVPQERALNEGRDFLDILEACRPKNSGALPSPLQAILNMYRRGEKMERPNYDSFNDEDGGDSDELKPLREWTSMYVDFEEPRAARPRSASLGPKDRSSDNKSDSSVASSPSSSYASLVGVSFDKHLLGQQKAGAPLGGVHLQRSPSLEYNIQDVNEDTDTVKSEGSWSSVAQENSSDPPTDEEAAPKDKYQHAAFLRKLIANHDSNYFKAPEMAPVPSIDTSRHQPGNMSPVGAAPLPPHRFAAVRTESSQNGGIGAALSHYTVSHDDSISNRLRVTNPTESIGSSARGARMTEGPGVLSSRASHWNDLGTRGISPLVLPPPGSGPGSDPPELVRPEDRSISSRLLTRDYKAAPSREGMTSRSLNNVFMGRTPTSHLLSGELFVDPSNPKTETVSAARSSVGGSPRAADLYRSSLNHQRKPEKARPRHRESSASHRHSRVKVFNPFRQEDEDKVLAKRSHNRRRWSHVFPAGEIEFKRHAGPIWKSLTSPAILPLSVDYFPSRQEIDQFFQFNIYNVTLSDFENTPYSTHADLLMEMVRQRLSQDYQLVPPSCVDETIRRPKPMIGHAPFGATRATSVIPNLPAEDNENVQTIKHFMTMGHQLQELTYDPTTDTIEVVRFNNREAQNDELNTYKYQYLLYSPLTQKYSKVTQTFKKFANQYNWNKVDRIICGDEDKTLREGMRFRRLMYGLIPPKFTTPEDEQDYIGKFRRLAEYLSKVREVDSLTAGVTMSTSKDPAPNLFETKTVTGAESMYRSSVQLRKGKQDPFEWIELASDVDFSTSKSFRIVYNWLAASASKVDTQVQLLHRRCTQYGLNLIFFPQTSISRDLLLNPFRVPPTFSVRDAEKAKLLYTSILDLDFVNDGVFYTQTKPILECIESGDAFDFGRRLSTAARQYVHRSGTLFVRLIRDRRGWVIVVVIANVPHIKRDEERADIAKMAFRQLALLVSSLVEEEEEDS